MLDGIKELKVAQLGVRVPKDERSVACESVVLHPDALHAYYFRTPCKPSISIPPRILTIV